MSSELWIEIPKWNEFQHYRDRRPTWIKIYTELLDDPNFGALTHAQRSTLLGLWLMYASSRREIPVDTAWITRQLNVRVTRATLEALNHAGFIRFVASRPLASRARSREVEEEKSVKDKSTYVEPLATWSYPQVDETDETFDFDKIKYSPREMP